MKKAAALFKQATEAARSAETWADLSNALFDPYEGLVTTAYTSRAEREVFRRSEEYNQIRELLAAKMKATGLIQGATPRKSGRFVVRLPQSLHAALEQEAAREGVSLNQLVVAKLAFQLRTLAQDKNGPALVSASKRQGRDTPNRRRKTARTSGR